MDQENLKKIIELRHELHANPELSNEEKETRQRLMGFIKENTDLQVVDRGRWFYAAYISPKAEAEPIAFRADFDALPIQELCELPYASKVPGVAHKCGHDGHSAALAGLALEVARTGADRDVYFIFQHAEEIGAGGEEAAGLIEEKQISSVYAYHNISGYPEKSIAVREGVSQCASRGLTAVFTGKKSHASQPEMGRNPALAVAQTIQYMYDVLDSDCFEGMVLGTVIHTEVGTRNFGISAGKGEVSMTLRAVYEKELDIFEAKMRERACELADRDGLKIEFIVSDPFPETVSHAESVKLLRSAAEELGLEVIELEEPIRGSEDFGYYTRKCPGAMFHLGNGTDYAALHTGEYDFNDRILETAVDMFVCILKKLPA